jgi:hypothetical protein
VSKESVAPTGRTSTEPATTQVATVPNTSDEALTFGWLHTSYPERQTLMLVAACGVLLDEEPAS